MDYAKESLRLHGEWKGKTRKVTPRAAVETKDGAVPGLHPRRGAALSGDSKGHQQKL